MAASARRPYRLHRDVQPSAVDHTVAGTRSNHLALYGFITY
ncbi:hypothetical protein O7626_13465 [Micromonospora sp. WMMD1102]|nr:hypothetical protein [Micromonospora sp. WMMD1102]MDG4786927.1 hypothetical protein [Micromonospora sp. WMMD1102]